MTSKKDEPQPVAKTEGERYQELMAQIASLKAEADSIRSHQRAEALEKIRQLVADFGFAPEDIWGHRRFQAQAQPQQDVQRRKMPVKYRNETTGETWTGQGRPPRWILQAQAEGVDVKRFLVAATPPEFQNP